MNDTTQNPNDYKVVAFHNSTSFRFTPEMGCMFDGRPINGVTGEPGVGPGETMTVPYHIGHQLALNLAKVSITKDAPVLDAAGIPTGVPMWDDARLITLKNSYLKELYVEEKAKVLTETDKLMAKVEEYKAMVDSLVSKKDKVAEAEVIQLTDGPRTYVDKAEVLAELTKRGIKFDARVTKAELEKLLV